MAKQRSAPKGLDYVPIPGDNPELVFGVVRATLAGKSNTATGAIARRLFPVGPQASETKRWKEPTCFMHAVVLPPWAGNDLIEPLRLCQAYDDQCWEGVKDLVIMTSVRFPGTVSLPPTETLHAAFERARDFARRQATERQLASIIAMHVPHRAGNQLLPPHVHVMTLARELGPAGFGAFASDLARDSGRELIERAWSEAG